MCCDCHQSHMGGNTDVHWLMEAKVIRHIAATGVDINSIFFCVCDE